MRGAEVYAGDPGEYDKHAEQEQGDHREEQGRIQRQAARASNQVAAMVKHAASHISGHRRGLGRDGPAVE